MKIRNAFGTRFSGAIGDDMIASSWRGRPYVRQYACPRNPRTELQQKHRSLFAQAVKAWQSLTARQKEFYDRIGENLPGYNIFVKRYVVAARNGLECETPIKAHWATADGQPIEDGRLIVRKDGKNVFSENLEHAEGEIALTASDAPYNVVLRKGIREDSLPAINSLLGVEWPLVLSSAKLGIEVLVEKM